MEQSYQIGEGTPVLGLHSRDSHWIWAAQQSLTLTQLPLNRDEHKPTACLLTTNFCFGRFIPLRVLCVQMTHSLKLSRM